eukprot:g261.t1
MGVKTCQFYSERLRAVEDSYGYLVKRRIFGSDGENPDPTLNIRTVVEPDWTEKVYIPPWAHEFKESGKTLDDVKPTDLPQLKKKLMTILKTLHDRFIEEVDWFLIVDDDTYVRVKPLEAYLSKLNPEEKWLIGSRVPSFPHLLREDYDRLGSSTHCGGGAGFILSRAALRAFYSRIDDCLASKHTLLHWYWDEVEFARCMWDYFGVECMEPDLGWGVDKWRESFRDGAKKLSRADLENFLSISSRFYSGITTPESWMNYKRTIDGQINDVGTFTFHKVTPERMQELKIIFNEDVDLQMEKKLRKSQKDMSTTYQMNLNE